MNTSIKGKKRRKKEGGGEGEASEKEERRRRNGENVMLLGLIPRSQTFQTTLMQGSAIQSKPIFV